MDCPDYRLGLFRKLVESLARTRWSGINPVWLLWDDNSPTKWFPSRRDIDIDMIHHVQVAGPAQNANVVDSLNEAQKLAPYTVCIDSDAIVHPEWVLKAFSLVEKYPNSPLYGLYNSKHHPVIDYNEFQSDDERTVFKHSNTIFGTLYRSECRGNRPTTEWCEQFVWRAPGTTPIIPVLLRSVIQHTGRNGLNSREGVTEADCDTSFEI